MNTILEQLIKAADVHGDNSGEPDHTIGDLQDMLREAWKIMTVSQKRQLLESDAVAAVVEAGADDEFDAVGLTYNLAVVITQLEQAVINAGYSFDGDNDAIYWELAGETSEDFRDHEDAVVSAHQHMLANRKESPEPSSGEVTQPQEFNYPKVVVLCTNSNGEPEFHTCTPEVTAQQIADGEHYDLAKANAAENGYEGPMIAFDHSDAAARQLGDVLAWI